MKSGQACGDLHSEETLSLTTAVNPAATVRRISELDYIDHVCAGGLVDEVKA
jgi:hypothetical protein